jgi:hypothetical protein
MIYPRVLAPLETLLVITDQAAVLYVAGLGIHVTGTGHHALATGVTDIGDLDGSDFSFYFWHWSLL